jgi:hypothetical protein
VSNGVHQVDINQNDLSQNILMSRTETISTAFLRGSTGEELILSIVGVAIGFLAVKVSTKDSAPHAEKTKDMEWG